MLSGEGNENGKKTTLGLISKKATSHVQHNFFFTFLCRCFAQLLRETSRNFLVTRFMEGMVEGMSDVFLFILFSLLIIFTVVAANTPPLQNFTLFLQQKMSPFVFSLSL